MNNATYISTEQDWQNQYTTYWYDVDGEVWGVSYTNGTLTIVDCDNYPVNTDDAKNRHLEELISMPEVGL